MSMTKEQLGEKTARIIFEAGCSDDWDVRPYCVKEGWLKDADKVLQTFQDYCDENNIKQVVEGKELTKPNPNACGQYLSGYCEARQDMLKAGYVKVEPVRLVE